MVEIRNIRNSIVNGLYEHMNLIPIPVESVREKEPYPFITYNFINPYTQFNGMGNYRSELAPSNDPKFNHAIMESLELQPQATISINTYSKDKMEATELAHDVMAWFKHIGYQYLSDNNIVVVGIEAFGDRSGLIVDHQEYRIGFDVIIRFTDQIVKVTETIEDINVDIKQ